MTAASARALLFSLAVFALPIDDGVARHVVDRLSFGARTSDVEHVRAVGVDRYIDEQLHPERLPDAGVEARLGGFATLRLTSREIAEQFELPQVRARRAAAANAGAADVKPSPAEQQHANTPLIELQEQKVLRAVYSTRQLQEVLVDFWFNHFNVDARKGADRFMLTEYERDVIRPHVFGKFRDLLGATAKSPAMLFYLDNWMSVDPAAAEQLQQRVARPAAANQPQQQAQQRRRGLNENYARELLELHTLGVDGGYTQKD